MALKGPHFIPGICVVVAGIIVTLCLGIYTMYHTLKDDHLVHPFLKDLRAKSVKRYTVWDKEDMVKYMDDVHEDVQVEVYVKNQVIIDADGFTDYHDKFDTILQSFITRGVHGHHTIRP